MLVRACGMVSYSFDTEVTQFLHVCLEHVDIRNEFPSYSAVYGIMKVSLLCWGQMAVA